MYAHGMHTVCTSNQQPGRDVVFSAVYQFMRIYYICNVQAPRTMDHVLLVHRGTGTWYVVRSVLVPIDTVLYEFADPLTLSSVRN